MAGNSHTCRLKTTISNKLLLKNSFSIFSVKLVYIYAIIFYIQCQT